MCGQWPAAGRLGRNQARRWKVTRALLLEFEILRNQLDRDHVAVDPCLCIFRISRGTIRKHYILGVLPHAARDLRLHRNKSSKENTIQHDRAKLVNTIACLNCEISDS